MILLMIASFSIPQAVSKLISERIALKDYKNAQKIFHGSLIYAAIVGGIVALVCFIWGKIYYSEQSAECSTGIADLITNDFPFRNPGCIQRIFSGIP